MGRRRIGLINLPGDITTGQNRLQGYQRSFNENGLSLDESIIAVRGRGQQEGYQRTLDLLSLPTDCQPDTLLVSSHLMTIGAITAIRQSEKHIPAEIPVIGFDDTPWAPLLDPPLTVVHQPAYEMGANSAELVQNRLYPEPNLDGAQHIVLPTTLVHRISCYSRGFYP